MTKSTRGMCGRKRRFSDDNAAERIGRPYGQRAYYCQQCGGYHLTKAAVRPRPAKPVISSPDAEVARARAALAELERKHVTGPLLDGARAHLAALLGKDGAA